MPAFVHTRRITWGDSDPARIAYTARFLDFAMEAVEAFFQDRLGVGFYEMTVDHGIGTPFVRVELEFKSPLTPRDTLATEVWVARVGGASVEFAVTGRVGERVAFTARLVCAFVAGEGAAIRAIPVPEEYRAKLEADVAGQDMTGHDMT